MSFLDSLTTQQKAIIGLGGGGALLYLFTKGAGAGSAGGSQLAVVDVRRPTDDANIMGGEGDRIKFNPIINVNPIYGQHPQGLDPVTSTPNPTPPTPPTTPGTPTAPPVTPGTPTTPTPSTKFNIFNAGWMNGVRNRAGYWRDNVVTTADGRTVRADSFANRDAYNAWKHSQGMPTYRGYNPAQAREATRPVTTRPVARPSGTTAPPMPKRRPNPMVGNPAQDILNSVFGRLGMR